MIVTLILLSVVAGLIGSVFGLGGGIIVVPVLTILYGMETMDAVAVSLVAIVAISSVSAASLVKERVANVRIGLRLEIGAAGGAILGAIIALYVGSQILAICFAFVLIYSAIYMFLRPELPIVADDISNTDDNFVYHDTKAEKDVTYVVKNIGTGTVGFMAAGITSALTGVGGGTIKIPIMNVHMRMPMKVATATSSYVIGITAFSGAAVYLLMGAVDIMTASVVIVGSFIGSLIGLRIVRNIDASSLRRYFSLVLIFLASVMLLNAGGVI